MRLLSKNEIQEKANADRAVEIAQGLKISRKVDSLRELAAKEEQTLEKFREESLSALQKDIDDLSNVRENLRAEVNLLRGNIAYGMQDVKQREKELNLLKEQLDSREKEVEVSIVNANTFEKIAKGNAEQSERELAEARTREERAEELHREAENAQNKAGEALLKAKQTLENIILAKEETEHNLLLRENQVALREIEVKEKEESLKNIAEEQKKEWIRIKDQRETLQRAINRIKK